MGVRARGLWVEVYVLAALLLPLASASGDGDPSRHRRCKDAVAAQAGESSAPTAKVVRHPSSIRHLHIVAYNLLNLEKHVGKHRREGNSLRLVPDRPPRLKSPHHREAQGGILEELEADLAILPEVEDKQALDHFNEDHLSSVFRTFLKRGNDTRKIDVGFLVRGDLPVLVEHRSNIHVTWDDPVSGRGSSLFSRDLPVLIFRLQGEPSPFLILLGTHYKSKRDRSGDRESRGLRRAQVDGTVAIIRELQREFGETVPIVLGGDANGNVNAEAEFANLKKALDLQDAFDVVNPPLSRDERVTHTFHPLGGATKRDQLDMLMVSPSLRACVVAASVYRYKDEDGNELPLPETYAERKKNPSDHFPIRLTLDFPCVLRVAQAARLLAGAGSAVASRKAAFGK